MTRNSIQDTPGASIPRIAIACQGGGALAAFTAGVLARLTAADLASEFHLAGLSGTSGGALTASTAWAELLRHGPARVGDVLRCFWQDNSAQYPWELLSNAVLVAAASGTVDVTLSPYMFPLAFLETAAKLISPRKQFVDLESLIRLHLPVDELEIFARFEALAPQLQNWLTGVDGNRLGLSYVNGQEPAPKPKVIRRIVSEMRRLRWAILERAEIAQDIQRIEAIATSLNGSDISPAAASDIFQILTRINSAIPMVLAGAVDARSGQFKAFSSALGELNVEALLASSAVPWAFRAVGGRYWDGLFSQNPPIRNFLTDAVRVEDKPDEIWLVQLANQTSPEPVTGPEIVTRRIELSSNLSVNQELAAIRALNRRLTQGTLQDPGCKLVAIHWIRLDHSLFSRDSGTGAASMVDRASEYINALMEHGLAQATAFLPARAFVEEIWNQPDLDRRRLAERRWCGSGAGQALEIIEAMHRDFDYLHIDVDGMDIGGGADINSGAAVEFTWTACGLLRQAGEFVVLQGSASLFVATNVVQSARITDISLSSISGAAASASVRNPA